MGLTFSLAVNFSEFDKEPSGKVNLIGRVKYDPFFISTSFQLNADIGAILMSRNDITQNYSSRYSPMALVVKEAHTNFGSFYAWWFTVCNFRRTFMLYATQR